MQSAPFSSTLNEAVAAWKKLKTITNIITRDSQDVKQMSPEYETGAVFC
jgi:hypothetical protein